MQLCAMEASKSCTKITVKLFHAEILSHLKKKIWQNKKTQKQSKRKKKQQQINQKQQCLRLYTHHIRSGVFKDFTASCEKTPLTPDKGRKRIPTCGGVELKRPSLIMTNTN